LIAYIDPVESDGSSLSPDAILDLREVGVEVVDWLRLSKNSIERVEVEVGIRDETSERSILLAGAPVPMERIHDRESAKPKGNKVGKDQFVLSSMVKREIAEFRSHADSVDTIDLLVVEKVANGAFCFVVGDSDLVELIRSAPGHRDNLSVGSVLVESTEQTGSSKWETLVDDEDSLVGEEEVCDLPSPQAHSIIVLLEGDGVEAARRESIVIIRELDSTSDDIRDVVVVQIDVAAESCRVDEFCGVARVLFDCGETREVVSSSKIRQELDVIETSKGIRSTRELRNGDCERIGLHVEFSGRKVHIGGVSSILSVQEREE